MALEFETQYEQFYASFSSFQFEPNDINIRDIFNTVIIELFDLTVGDNSYSENKESDNENDNRLGENCINFSLLTRESYNLKCTWGKIIGLFSLTGSLATKFYEMNALNLIYCLVDLLTDFINNDKRMFTWISSQGGWNSLMDYFNERYQIFNLTQVDDIEDCSIKNQILNFANNNSCVSTRPSSPTPSNDSSNILSRSISDSITLSQSDNQSYLTILQNQFKNKFFRLSQYAAVGVGSVGVLVIGALFMKKRI